MSSRFETPGTRKKREFREETQVRITSQGIRDANAPSTAIPDLIREDPQNKNEHATQLRIIQEDPIGRFVTEKIAEIVYDDGFYLAERGTDKEHPRNEEFQREFDRMNGKWIMTQALFAERGYGHVWIDVIPPKKQTADMMTDSVPKVIQPKVAKLEVHTPLHTTVTTWHPNGMPDDLEVRVRLPDGTDNILPRNADTMIFMRTRPFGDGSYRGLSVLATIWDIMNYVRQVLFSMGWFSVKTGIGVFFVRIKGAVTAEKKAAAESMLEGLSQKRGVIYSDLIIDEFGYVEATAGNPNFPEYLKALLGQVAMVTRIPQTILTGDNQGSIAGSEVNSDLQVAVINTEQQKQDFYLRQLIARMGFDMDYDIVWNVRFATNEEKESKILGNNTQADSVALSYMSVNEVRERRDLPNVPGGEEVLGLRKSIEIGVSSEKPKEDPNNETGEQV